VRNESSMHQKKKSPDSGRREVGCICILYYFLLKEKGEKRKNLRFPPPFRKRGREDEMLLPSIS